MSLRDEASDDAVRPGYRSAINRLIAELPADEGAEIVELLRDGTIGHAVAARVLKKHYGDRLDGRTEQQVGVWRSRHGVVLL